MIRNGQNAIISTVALVTSTALGACGDEPATGVPLVDERLTPGAAIDDQTPRDHMALHKIWEAVRDPEETNGTVLVGLKEPTAVRGVALDGRELPLEAKFAAEGAIRRNVPASAIVRGVAREINGVDATGRVIVDTMFRTYVTYKPDTRASIELLRSLPWVDYVVPNYRAGTLGLLERDAMMPPSAVQTTPWGVNKIRAPEAWALGYDGGNVITGLADTGFDGSFIPGPHPDMAYPRGVYNLVVNHGDNRCEATSALEPCWWEDVFHGTGVIGIGRGVNNAVGSVGAAPSTDDTFNSCHAIVLYFSRFLLDYVLYQEDFADGVLYVSDGPYCGPARVAVTSVGYESQCTTCYETLHDAFRTAYYQKNALWFAAAGNNADVAHGGQGYVEIPALFPEVVAVGAVRSNLLRANFSPRDTAIELVAPGVDLRMPWNRRDDDCCSHVYTHVDSGTSFAAPQAMAVARIAAQKFPAHSAQQLRQELQQHARDLGPGGRDDVYGYGFVDALCVISQLAPCVPVSVYIDGPLEVIEPGQHQWEAMPSGGNGNYTYVWYYRPDGGYWQSTVTSRTYTRMVEEGDPSFELKVEAASALDTDVAHFYVEVMIDPW